MLQINCVSSLLDKESLFNSTTQSQFGFCASERAGRSGSFTSLGQSIAASLLTTHTATNDVNIMDNYFPLNEDFARKTLCLMTNARARNVYIQGTRAQSANSQCEQHAPRDPTNCLLSVESLERKNASTWKLLVCATSRAHVWWRNRARIGANGAISLARLLAS